MQKFVKVTDDMVANNLNIARYLIADLKMGYKHHNLNCITFTPGFRSICGFSLPQFTQLLNFIKPQLLKFFAHSPVLAEGANFCEIRMKLFITLFHLKMGQPYRALTATFGWCKSAIERWCKAIQQIINRVMKPLRNLLVHLGHDWQRNMCFQWRLQEQVKGNFSHFVDRANVQNKFEENRNNANRTGDFIGSLGAVDCTYTMQAVFAKC